jgi:hypothetical protein
MVGPSQFRTTGGRAPVAATTTTEFTADSSGHESERMTGLDPWK